MSTTRPVEIWRDRNNPSRWQWRCHCHGLFCGGWAISHAAALKAAMSHIGVLK